MRRPFIILPTVALLTGAAVFSVTLCGANAVTDEDSAPILLPPQRNAPRWETLGQLQHVAAQGDPEACFELGFRYLEGDELPKNASQAIALFEKAAQGGFANASFRLGKIYFDGIVVPVDYARAIGYYTTAARAGVFEAQYNLGVMLVSAKGVKRNYVEGLAWLILATKSGAPANLEKQVRARLVKYPDKILAAEARCHELEKDLAHATVLAELIGVRETPSAAAAQKPVSPVPVIAPPEKPVIAPLKMESPGKLELPLPVRPPPSTTPKKEGK